jgi:hypothetical protein
MKENVSTGKTTTVATAMFAALVVTLAFSLIFFGHSAEFEKFTDFLVWLIPITVGQLFISRQNNEIRSKLNGSLDAKFADLHVRFDTLSTRIDALETRIDSASDFEAVTPEAVEDVTP